MVSLNRHESGMPGSRAAYRAPAGPVSPRGFWAHCAAPDNASPEELSARPRDPWSPSGDDVDLMSLLERVGITRPTDSRSGGLAPVSWPDLLPGARAAAGTWLLLALPALLVWVVEPLTTVPWGQAVAVASAGWFLGHGIPVALGGASISLTPLGLWAVVLMMTTRSVRRLLDRSEAAAPGTTWERQLLTRILPGYAAGYAAAALVAWLLTLSGPARPTFLGVVGVLWVPALAVLICLLRRHARDEAAPLVARVIDRLPRWATRAVVPGLQSAAALVGLGALLVVLAVVVRFGTVTGLHAALGPGLVGGVALVLGQLLLAPNLALWALSFIAGPGFSIAVGSSITVSGAQPGLLPLVPVLGALPNGGPFPGWVVGLLALPVVVGGVTSFLVTRPMARLASWQAKLMASAAAVTVSAVVITLLTVLGSGSVGLERLRHVGPSAFLMGAALLGELLLGAVLNVAVDRVRQHRR